MFGESDSESPRVPSPWDSLTPPPTHSRTPKLVPEAEEGNVEYKLQLLSPSPGRFTRLVTQLKWRLLEGGGQAYYELGVADSGVLVGLPRQQLEESLETLEMMAGEIGASVIVVKEIEVPPELSSLAESQLERWDGKKSTRRKDLSRTMKQDGSPITSAIEVETEHSTMDTTGVEETTCYPPTTSPASLDGEFSLTQPRSPNLLPFDPALATSSMGVGEGVASYVDDETLDDNFQTDHIAELFVNLEVSSVYKPRPMKKRAVHITSPPSTHFEYTKKRLKNGYPLAKSSDTACHTGGSIVQHPDETHTQLRGTKARLRRDKQDKRRELKLSILPTHVPTRRSTDSSINSVDHHAIPSRTIDELDVPVPTQVAVVEPQTGDASRAITIVSKEPRLIIEALVVRKLSLDEAFLDFEGFSLL